MIITKAEARQLLLESFKNEELIRAVFVKRTTGEVRLMDAKVEEKQPMLEQDLILVTDLDKRDYRYIPLEGLDGLRIGTGGESSHWMTVRG